MKPLEVRVTVQGQEVAKWIRRTRGGTRGELPPLPYAVRVHQSSPIYVDIDPYTEEADDIPYIGSASVEFHIMPGAFRGDEDNLQLMQTALSLLRREGVPIDICEKLQVQVDHGSD